MLNTSKTRLQIFDDESRNYKFETLDAADSSNSTLTFNSISNQIITSSGESIWLDYPKKRFNFKFPKLKLNHVLNPIKFFQDIKKVNKQLDENSLKMEMRTTIAIMREVEKVKQQALAQQLTKEKERIQRELILCHHGYKYLDEEDIINYCKKDPKDIKLDWIKNFTRIIPQKSMQLIDDALLLSMTTKEKIRLFDNIVIMHYDPKQNGSQLTEKEKEKKRDPIAFGVMKCSTRLYFITDWTDEHCDLTLKKVLKVLSIEEKEFDVEEELKKQM